MPLTANRDVDRFVDQELRSLPVKAGARIFRGAFVGFSGGLVRPLVNGDPFAGVAYEEANNVGGADGAVSVRVYTQGDVEHPLSSATRASNGNALYASDDCTLTVNAAGNSLIGRQVDVPSSGRVIVRLRPWMIG